MTEELQIVVHAREESAKTFAEIVRSGPQMVQAIESMQAILAANEVQVAEVQAMMRKIVEAMQPQLDEVFATMRKAIQKLLASYTMPVIPRYYFDLPAITLPPAYLELGRPSLALLERLQADRPQPIFGPITPLNNETEEATMMTGTASAPVVFGDVDSPETALDEIDLLFDEVLQENDNFRLQILELRAEIRGWKLSAAMGWTVPYPRLKPEDFDDLERQP